MTRIVNSGPGDDASSHGLVLGSGKKYVKLNLKII